jgi:hypothetical protein
MFGGINGQDTQNVNKLLNDLWKLRIAKTEAADIQKK